MAEAFESTIGRIFAEEEDLEKFTNKVSTTVTDAASEILGNHRHSLIHDECEISWG